MITANFKPAKLKKEGPNFFKDFETQVKWIGNRILWLKYFLDRKWMETEQWYSEYNRGGPLDISMKEQCKTWLLGLDGCLILWYWGSFYEPTTCFFGGEPFLQQNQYNKQKQQNAKKKHSMNNEQFCVALFFPPLFSKRSCFPPFLHPGRWTPHPFRKEKWSEPNLHEDMCKMWIFQGCIFSLFPTFRILLVSASEPSGAERPSSFRPACGCQHRTCRCWRSRPTTWTYINLGVGTTLSQ